MNTLNINNILRNTDNFSFIKNVTNFICNRDLENTYKNNSDLSNNLVNINEQSYLWYALSAIGEETGNIIYSNINNYIDLVSNVDLCKIKTLKSMIQNLGISYTVFDRISFLPIDILNLMDTISINKKYLQDVNVLNTDFYNDLSSNVFDYVEISSINSNKLSGNIFNNDKFENYISSLYFNILKDNIEIRNDTSIPLSNDEISSTEEFDYISSDNFICNILSDQILENDLNKENIKKDKFLDFKFKNNIDKNFRQDLILNNIENGLDTFDNYSGAELELLYMEKNQRNSAYDLSKPTTKFYYYKKEKVLEYIKFIEDKIYNNNELLSLNDYVIDNNFIEVKKTPKQYLFSIDNKTNLLKLNKNILKLVANDLKEITCILIKLRDEIKIQIQKNYLKGTFNLLSFMINEYLINFNNYEKLLNDIKLQIEDYKKTDKFEYNKFYDENGNKTNKYLRLENNIKNIFLNLKSYLINNIELVEYVDTTEYFNIKTDTTDNAKFNKNINIRYWEFEKNINNFTNDINKYYISKLLNHNNSYDYSKNLDLFLNTIYDIGADNSYVDDKNNPICKTTKIEKNIFENYINNNEFGKMCYLNYKNETHPSYQIHPYLYNFVEKTNYSTTINNSFLNEDVNTIIKKINEENLSSFIGNFGQTIDIYKNNLNDYSGYKTSYENVSHHENNILDNFEGAFYEPAINELISLSADCINSIKTKKIYNEKNEKTFFGKYYVQLNLSDSDYLDIADKLTQNIDLIIDIVKSKDKNNYDIFKYGKDNLNNHYILYKSYNNNRDISDNFNNKKNQKNIEDFVKNNLILNTGIDYNNFNISSDLNYKEKLNTLGELWIRLDKHPIAFPAFYGLNPQITVDSEVLNGRFENLTITDLKNQDQKILFANDKYHMRYFYDIEINNNFIYLWNSSLTDYKSRFANNSFYKNPDNFKKLSNYQCIEKADIIISKIDYKFNIEKNKTEIVLIPDNKTRIDSIDNPGVFPDNETEYFYKGLIKNNLIYNFIFIKNTKNNFIEYNLVSYLKENSIEYKNNNLLYSLNNNKFDFAVDDNFYKKCLNINYFNNNLYIPILISAKNDVKISNILNANLELNSLCSDTSLNFERFNSEILISKFDIINFYNYIEFKHNSDTYYNLHTDPSYFPSYPGIYGKNYIPENKYLSKNNEKSIQFLGNSQENIEDIINKIKEIYNITEDNTQTLNTQFDYQISNIIGGLYGRIWENLSNSFGETYEEILNDIIKTYQNPVLNTKISSQYDISKKEFTFTKTIGKNTDIFSNVNLNNLSNLNILVFNTHTYGKNPYYIGSLSSLINDKENVIINYLSDDNHNSEISSNYSRNFYITGTYNYFNNKEISKLENNHIKYIDGFDINAIINEKNNSQIDINIKLSGENIPDEYYIKENTIKVILYNKYDMRFYEFYHYLDHLSGLTHEENNKLADVSFDDISALNEIPVLTFNNDMKYLSMKLDEEIQFNNDNLFFEFEKHDDKNLFLINPIEILEKNNLNNYSFNKNDKNSEFYILSCIWENNNLFINQIDKSTIINNIENINFENLFNVQNEKSYRMYEDAFLNFNNEYDLNDPSILKFLKVYEENINNETDMTISNDLIIDVLNNNTGNQINNYLNKLDINLSASVSEEILNPIDIDLNYIIKKDEFNETDLNKLFNIYGSFKKDKNNNIILYFNYINFINSPFIKVINKKDVSIDIIPGTYLKLNPGESGNLDILVQYRLYNDFNEIISFTTKKIYSYTIYNVSDIKPKFLIYNNFSI